MDQATCSVVAGIGFSAIVARSHIGYPFRRAATWLAYKVAGWFTTKSLSLPQDEDWCLYCVGFHVGLTFGFVGFGWLANPLMDGFFLAGVTWVISEVMAVVDSLWILAFAGKESGGISTASRNDLHSPGAGSGHGVPEQLGDSANEDAADSE